jgi:integrase/recombinase XerD
METPTPTVSPLRQRMIEDMRMRKLAPKTQTTYIRAVRKLSDFLGHSPDRATDEDLRRFQLNMVDTGASPITLNATIVGLNFLFEVTLGRPEVMAKMQSVRVLSIFQFRYEPEAGLIQIPLRLDLTGLKLEVYGV